MARPNQLFLLADHIKLSLLERQRAQSLLNTDAAGAGDAHDGQISRSLNQFRSDLAALEEEADRLREGGDETGAQGIADSLPSLKRQLEDLTSQFHGFSTPASVSTLTHPNDASLSADFAHATSAGPVPPSDHQDNAAPPKTVRFRDSTPTADVDLEAQRRLFGAQRYRDDPSEGYVEAASTMDNQQIHAYHQQVLDDQDTQLDALGESIGRQRELSMRIGDELDEHIAMLDEVDGAVTRQQGRLNTAGRQLGRISRAASSGNDSRGMVVIVVLIIILVLLIAILK